jgi:hypothetical protein
MTHRRIELSDVIYNAADQSFEALVTIHEPRSHYRYACSIIGPITMTFEDAAQGLTRQAQRRHRMARGLRSETRHHIPPARAGRPRFDAVGWLSGLIAQSDQNAA